MDETGFAPTIQANQIDIIVNHWVNKHVDPSDAAVFMNIKRSGHRRCAWLGLFPES